MRLEMLEEAVEVIRTLWQGGEQSHRGRHYTVENARIYDLPEQPPPILVSGFGPKAIELAARIGDGFVHDVSPTQDAIERYPRRRRRRARRRRARRSASAPTRQQARETAHRLWPNEALPGELAQILPTPAHFEQACELVTRRHARRRRSAPTSTRTSQSLRQYARRGRRRAVRPADRPRPGTLLRRVGAGGAPALRLGVRLLLGQRQ